MNREILFRGKRVDGHGWAEGGIVPRANGQIFIAPIIDASQIIISAVDPDTVGQYTGLTDKNGKRIFEGDIMEFDAWGFHYRGVVSFVDGNSSVICKRPVSDTDASPFLDDAMKRYDAVCVGNVHDNPEMVEV